MEPPRVAVVLDLLVSEDWPACQEVERVLPELKGAELFGVGGESMTRWLRTVIVQVWSTSVFPQNWRRGLVTPNYKGRGVRMDCNNYRGITLLSVQGRLVSPRRS